MQEFLGAADDESVLDLVELGLHHEQQHQELLLMDIKHVLSINPLRPAYVERAERSGPSTATVASQKHAPAAPGWFGHGGGLVAVGHEGEGFSFDNEQPRHEQYLEPFALATRPVTNANWLEFIADGGYQQPGLWLSDGWATVIAEQWEAPLYWWRDDDGWHQFTLHGACPVQADEPVCHVSYYEADAYARWSGARLPTEYEWEVVAGAQPFGGRFLDTEVLHPRPVVPDGPSPRGLFGDVWEWTASAYAPYPGFRPAAGAVGEYNGKFMVNQQVLRGGCCVTPAGHTRPTYRNFFPPGARWAFSGLRLAKDA
jgi:ergothioneine biosynthesis protein EgtB